MEDLQKRYSQIKDIHFEKTEDIEKYMRLAVMVSYCWLWLGHGPEFNREDSS